MFRDYVENAVEHVEPVELVRMLYAKAIEQTRLARHELESGRIRERAQAVAHVQQILIELQGSLDADRGGAIAGELDRLYVYMQERLVEANAEKRAEPLEEVERLLETLYAGWRECRPQRPSAVAAECHAPEPTASAEPAYAEAASAVGRAWTG